MDTRKLNSPVTGKAMCPITLEEGLEAFKCPDSGGHYIPAVCYMRWLEKQPARLPHLAASDSKLDADTDSTVALLCPESGTLMQRYKVGHGFGFAINRSVTGGIWLDAGEWEALRHRNFHDEINLVFTAPWQKQVRDEQSQATYEENLQSALGSELVSRLMALREDLANHPNRNLAIAFLANGVK